MRAFVLAVFVAAILPAPASTQVLMSKGPAHQRLEFLVGEWDVASVMHFQNEEHASTHSVTYRWLPGGVWLDGGSNMPETPIGPMFGSARIGWDENASEYVHYWIDNQSTVVLSQRGRFVNDSTLEFRGSFEWVDGTVYYQRLEIHRLPNGWREVGFMGTDPADLTLNHEGTAKRVR